MAKNIRVSVTDVRGNVRGTVLRVTTGQIPLEVARAWAKAQAVAPRFVRVDGVSHAAEESTVAKKKVDPSLEALEASDAVIRQEAREVGSDEDRETAALVDEIEHAAEAHAIDVDREHEAGDLLEALRGAWKLLTPKQRRKVFDSLDLWKG